MNALPAMGDPPQLQVRYVDAADDASLTALLSANDTLAVLGFGGQAPTSDDPRYLRVALEPFGAAPLEHWRGSGPVSHGRDGDIAWAEDGALLFGSIELDEDDVPSALGEDGDIEAAATESYGKMVACLRDRGYPHLLRTWNYLDGITTGRGDEERYRRFCVGRARGMGEIDPGALPAATAIGRVDGERRLQVYWLAARLPGIPLENPRQISAYRYPRQYGPQPPSFARAMLPPQGAGMPLLLSGTAAIVGHESQHPGSVVTQVDETFANFDSLLVAARARRPDLPASFGPGSHLKVYLRDHADLAPATEALDRQLGGRVPLLLLNAAICRRELRVEIDGMHASSGHDQ